MFYPALLHAAQAFFAKKRFAMLFFILVKSKQVLQFYNILKENNTNLTLPSLL